MGACMFVPMLAGLLLVPAHLKVHVQLERSLPHQRQTPYSWPCFPPCSPVLDDMLSPEELSSFVLEHLKKQAEAALGEPVTGAVSLLFARLPACPTCAARCCCRCRGWRLCCSLPPLACLAHHAPCLAGAHH